MDRDRRVGPELSELADELLEQATELRRQWGELCERLGVEAHEHGDAAPVAAPGGDDDEAVRLVALDMMLSGHSKDEVREHLAATFGPGDRDALLDEVFAT